MNHRRRKTTWQQPGFTDLRKMSMLSTCSSDLSSDSSSDFYENRVLNDAEAQNVCSWVTLDNCSLLS